MKGFRGQGEARQRSIGGLAAKTLMLLLVMLMVAPLGGCRKLKNMLGIGDEVINPEPESPEALIRDLLAAANDTNKNTSWQAFVDLLHVQERSSRGAMSACRRTYWPGFRRKAEFFLTVPAKMGYEILDDRPGETESYRKIFIRNLASEHPTPIPLKRDPSQNDEWRIAVCSL